MLEECPGAPVESHDLVMLDLDGVVYIGGEAVPGAPEHLAAAGASRAHLAYVTNNASRPPEEVAAHLQRLGIAAEPHDVVTSAQAAAHLLATELPAGAAVALLGGGGLLTALEAEGLRPVPVGDPDAAAIVSGYGPDVPWRDVVLAAIRIGEGLPWVASNTDHTIPTRRGPGPGHGVLVRTLQDFTGVAPRVAGKPARHLLDETVRRVGGTRPLMVGDRLDTDIEGARIAGHASLLVLTGVTGLQELVRAGPEQRPTYLAPDLAGLLEPHPAPRQDQGAWTAGGWTAEVHDGELDLTGAGAAADWWRATASAAWDWLDRTGAVAECRGLAPPLPARDAPEG